MRVESLGHGQITDDLLTSEERADEFLLMGLRLAEGIDPARYQALAGRPLDPDRIATLDGARLRRKRRRRVLARHAGRLSRCSTRWWPIWRPDALAAGAPEPLRFSSIKGATHACPIVLAYRSRCVDEHRIATLARSADAVNVATPSVVIFAIPYLDRRAERLLQGREHRPTLDIVPNGREMTERVLNGASQFSLVGPDARC